MKAAVYDQAGPASVFRYADLPDPQPGPDEVLIAVEAISLEGGDLIHRRTAPPPHPDYVVGYAASGTITAIGSNVTDRKVGDRVASVNLAGSHAALRVVKASMTWLVPDGVDIAQASVVPVAFGTAYQCLFVRGGLKSGESLLVQGAAGGVGVAAVQLARQAGATVIAVASGTERTERLLELGAHHVIDRQKEDVVERVKEITGGRGVDLVLDPVGTTLPASLQGLCEEGRLVFVGNAGGGSDLKLELWPAMQKNQSLHGVYLAPLLERPATRQIMEDMFEALAKGQLKVVIDRVFPLSDAAGAHEFSETAKPLGRVILKP